MLQQTKNRENQAIFPAKHSTIGTYVHYESYWNKHAQQDINICFGDESALDRLDREQMWKILKLYCVLARCIKLVKLSYEGHQT